MRATEMAGGSCAMVYHVARLASLQSPGVHWSLSGERRGNAGGGVRGEIKKVGSCAMFYVCSVLFLVRTGPDAKAG